MLEGKEKDFVAILRFVKTTFLNHQVYFHKNAP